MSTVVYRGKKITGRREEHLRRKTLYINSRGSLLGSLDHVGEVGHSILRAWIRKRTKTFITIISVWKMNTRKLGWQDEKTNNPSVVQGYFMPF
jgi:hypothetical protein